MKIPPVEAAVLYVDRQTDITKLTVAFRSFANAPKTQQHLNKVDKVLYQQSHNIPTTYSSSLPYVFVLLYLSNRCTINVFNNYLFYNTATCFGVYTSSSSGSFLQCELKLQINKMLTVIQVGCYKQFLD